MLYLFEDLSDVQLQAEILKKTAGAEDEAKTRTEIRGLIDGFRTQITTIIANGDVMDPANADTTPDSPSFANLFLTEEKIIKSDAALQTLYRSKLEDHRGTLHPHFERDFNNTRLAIDTALNDKKAALMAELKVFTEAGDLTTGKPFRRRKDAVDAFVASKAAKPVEQALINTLPADRDRFENEANTAIYAEHNKLRAAPLIPEIKNAQKKVDEYREAMTAIFEKIGTTRPRDKARAEIWDELKGGETILFARSLNLNALLLQAKMIDNWQAGKIKPADFVPGIVATVSHPAEKVEVTTNFTAKIGTVPNAASAAWDIAGASDRLTVAEEIKKDDAISVSIAEELERIKTHVEDCKKELEVLQIPEICGNFSKFLEAEEEKKKGGASPGDSQNSIIDNLKGFYQDLGITWMTPMQMYMGWKKYWETRKAAQDERDRRAAVKFAQAVGDFVGMISPFKQFENDVQQTLKATDDGEDNKAKSGFMDLLKSNNATFDTLFGPGGEYEKNQHDCNRTRAVLEYAASKGWLYHMDRKNHTVMGKKLIAGRTVPPGESSSDIENYIDSLKTDDTTGGQNSRKNGQNKISSDETWDPIVQTFKQQLDEHNYWSAIGVMEAAIGRGKNAATVPTLAAMFIRHLRNDPIGRANISGDMVDQIAGISFNNVTWGYFALAETDGNKKKKLVQWARNAGNHEASLSSIGGIGVAIEHLEKEIRRLGGNITTDKMDELVGRALAGQVLKEPSWSEAISIFDDKYKEYRGWLAGADPGKVAGLEDFKQDSEAILVQGQGLKKILLLTSQGRFTNDAFATAFLADLVTKHEQLTHPANSIDPSIKRTYEEHWQNAFEDYMLNEPRLQNADQTLWTFAPRTVNPDGAIGGDGAKVSLWQTLYAHKLIKRETLVAKNNAFAKIIDPSI